MTEKEERLARDRAEIAARVASFKETQQKFEREREEYYETTLANALNGPTGPRSGVEAEPAEAARPSRYRRPIWRVEPQANCTKRIREFRKNFSERLERSRRLDVFLSSAATLREVKA